MPPKLLIGLTGKAGAGKDTFANFFPDCERLAFAKPLKDAAHHLFNLTEKQLYDPDEKEKVDPMWGKSPRQLLQILGTELLREQLDKDIFIKNMEQRIQSSTADILFITDARFDNEAQLITKYGGVIVEIVRPELTSTIHTGHASEMGISHKYVTYGIVNDSTLDEYKTKAMLLMNTITEQ